MATATTKSMTASASDTAAEVGNDLRADLTRVDEELRVFVKERPILALLSAVAAGYLVGRLLRRLA